MIRRLQTRTRRVQLRRALGRVLRRGLQVERHAGVEVHAVFVPLLFVLRVNRQSEADAVGNAPGAAAVLHFGDFLVVGGRAAR